MFNKLNTQQSDYIDSRENPEISKTREFFSNAFRGVLDFGKKRGWQIALALSLTAGGNTAFNGPDNRVFSSSYDSVVNSFIEQNPGWRKLEGVSYQKFIIGKGNNQAYDSVPIIKVDEKGNIVDIGWPNSENKGDIISLLDILKNNGYDQALAKEGLSTISSENILQSYLIGFLRQVAPVGLETKNSSQSAAKVKSIVFNNFPKEKAVELITEIAKFKIPRVSDDRAIRFGKNTLDDGKQEFVYKIAGYKNISDFVKDYSSGKIEPKTEIGIASSIVYINYLNKYIEEKNKRAFDNLGSDRIMFKKETYDNNIHPIIKTAGGYGSGYTKRDNDINSIGDDISKIDVELRDILSKIFSKKQSPKIKELLRVKGLFSESDINEINQISLGKRDKNKLNLLLNKREKLSKVLEIKKDQRSLVSESHYTVTRNNLTYHGSIFSGLNRASAFYASDFIKVTGQLKSKNNLGTYDQFIVNIGNALNGKPLVNTDGDVGKMTESAMKDLNIDSSNKTTYENLIKKWATKVIKMKPTIEKAIDNGSLNAQEQDFLYRSFSTSIEVKYSVLSTIASYAKANNNPELVTQIDNSWREYIQEMNKSGIEELLKTFSNPNELSKLFPGKNIKKLYENNIIPSLLSGVFILTTTQNVVPEIQSKPSIGNISNTLFRLTNNNSLSNPNIVSPAQNNVPSQNFSMPIRTALKDNRGAILQAMNDK